MLDGNEKILCAVPSKDIISLYQNLNYHQADTIEGSLVLSEKYTSILNNVRYFAISDRESNHNFYLYRKTLVQVQNHEIAINGQGAFWDEMQGAYIKDRRPNQVTPADTIKLILGYSRWNVDYVDQMLEEESLRRDMNFYYVSLLDALNTVYQTWQVDIEPYINIEGHQITRRYVKLYQQQGGNNGRRFVYGDNALTVTQQANEGSIFTALVGRGAGVEETDASGNLTGGYSRKINFADIEWSKANGDPCDKPKGQEYVEWKESTELYGYSDGKPRIGIVNFDNEKDPAQLLKETWARLQQVGVPLVQFQATVGDVGYLNLGETVTIVRYDLNIKYQTRVTGIKWNRCDEAKSQITIGVKAIQSTADKIADLQQSVAQANVNADEAKSTANHAIVDGTGAVVNYGPNEPTNPKEGDIWYDVQPDGTVVLKQYQNGQWVILIDDTTGQQIKNKVEAQQKELDKAVQDANAASAKADGLVAQVGDANTNAQKALATAQQNQADLESAKSRLSNVQTGLTNAISNISQAQSDLTNTKQGLQIVKSDLANTKQSLANDEKSLSSLSQQAQQQGQTIVDIQKTQSGLSADIADVKGNVSSLQDTANSLQATVKDNQGNISKLQDTASGLQATVKDNQGNISKLQDTANSLQSSITDNKNNISSIKQTADGIQSTVSNMKVSSENLLPDTLDFAGWQQGGQGNMDSAQADNTLTNAWHAWGDNNSAWIGSPQAKPVYLSAGIQYTFSAVCWNNGTSTGNNFDNDDVELYFNNNDNSKAYNHQLTSKTNKDHVRYSVTFTVDTDGLYWGFKIVDMSGFIGGSLWSAEYMLVEGNVAVAYQPSSTAMATDISTVQQTVNGLESTVQNNKGDISQVQQTASKLESTITKQIGTYLSNGDFADTDISKYWASWASNNFDEVSVSPTDVPTMPINYMRIHCNANEEKTSIGTKDFIPVNINENLEIKAWSWLSAEKTGPAFQMFVHCFDSNNQEVNCFNGYFKYDKLNEWEKTDVTWETDAWGNSNIVSIKIELVVFSNGVDASGCVSGLEVVNGTSGIASQFTQSIDSITSKIEDADGDISTLKQTATSLTAQIGNATGDISSLKQRADSMESNISDNKNDISDLKQTASSLQSNIQSKTDISQFTQLSNAFQTVVQNIGPFYPDGDFSDTDLSKYYNPWDTCTSLDNFSVVTNNSDWGYYLQIYTPQGTINKMITKEYLPINANYPITFKGKSLLSYDGELKGKFQVYYHFYDSNKNQVGSLYVDWYKYDNNNVWQDFSSTLTPPSGAVYLRIETVLDNSEGSGTYWGALDNLSIENGEATIASKISQMSDDINLRVQKGDLLSQINIQAGSTLIQSKKLFLDASSVVFSGNAFIPSAAITDLSADKITAGTLNAGNVNIINLDVNKLVGNTTEFVRSGWTNAYGSHVQIDGGGMSITYGDWLTKFEPDGMVFRDGNEDIGGFTRIGMQNAPSWYSGLAFNASGDAEFLSIGAQDYHNDSQNPVPAKLLWMRQGINTYGYNSGWNFCDDVWAGQVGMSSIQYGDWNIHFEKITGNDGFSALTLVSGSGDGFYWGSDGSFGYVTNHGGLHNVRGSQIVYDINQNGGTCQSWSGVD